MAYCHIPKGKAVNDDLWVVQILSLKNGKIERETEPRSRRMAEKLEDGININLDHEKFYTALKKTERLSGKK